MGVVFLFFYGGGFFEGMSNSSGPNIFMENCATFNYRIGMFGFVSLAMPDYAAGNMALKDQQLSFKLINKHIIVFDHSVGKFGFCDFILIF